MMSPKTTTRYPPLPYILFPLVLALPFLGLSLLNFQDRHAEGRGYDWFTLLLHAAIAVTLLLTGIFLLIGWRAATPPPLRRRWWRLTGEAVLLVVSALSAAFGCSAFAGGMAGGWTVSVVSLAALAYIARASLRLLSRMRARGRYS